MFTVPYWDKTTTLGIRNDTRMRFTIGGSGTVETPSVQAAPVPAPRPQAPAAPAPTAPPQAEDPRQRANRIQACLLEAMKKYPVDAQPQAMVACSQIK